MEHSFTLIKQLVDDFRANEAAYLRPEYQESQVRLDFIDKFFTALGWDVSHQRQKNPYEQEVRVENRVKMEGSQRFADYAFFAAPNFRDVKFFAEAKKPAHDLASPAHYHQTVRYGWNAKTPIAVLTDFEELHILDCRYKPDLKTALNRKIEAFRYTDYADEKTFERIFYLIGREAVAGGSLEKFAASLPKPRGKAIQKSLFKGGYKPVDEDFLDLLDEFRTTLAHTFKNNNPSLDSESLTEAVQRTIDRLVFIRFLEDKGIEDPTMVDFRYQPSAWNAFQRYCWYLEPKYNGLVFKKHPVIDATQFIPPDDETFADICDELADPTSPYDFNAIPISILGSIYERFLGKVVVATAKRARVEEKPEVRKAGGVYYTPDYIVRYIVQETVGKLLYDGNETVVAAEDSPSSTITLANPSPPLRGRIEEGVSIRETSPSIPLLRGEGGSIGVAPAFTGQSPEFRLTPAEVAKLRIIDIACGSGSFLLEVYSQLLEYHLRYYTAHPEAAKKGDTATRDGKLTLSHKKRKEILVNNVYGVDIDFQATEVTQLSLYLKLMEDVTLNDSHQFSLLKEKMLPELKRNIVCGNSLIGQDILEGKLFDDKADHDLKPMNFEDVFPDIMRNGGFDAVVGNPPYIRIQGLQEFNPVIVDLLKKRYASAGKGNYDVYVVFVERALSLVKPTGNIGFILPHKFFNAQYGQGLRNLISKGKNLSKIVHFGDQQVFDAATTYTCLLFLSGSSRETFAFVSAGNLNLWRNEAEREIHVISNKHVTMEGWNFAIDDSNGLFDKLKSMPTHVLDVVERIGQGIRTSANEVYVLNLRALKTNTFVAWSESLQEEVEIERAIASSFLQGREIKPYHIRPSGKMVLIPYKYQNGKNIFIDQKEMKNQYPLSFKYLSANKEFLEQREHGKMKGQNWYAYIYPKNLELMKARKILVPDIADRASFALDLNGNYAFTSGYGITLRENSEVSIDFLLGLLNSKLLYYYLKRISTPMRGGFFRYFTQFIEQLPIRTINFEDPADKARHDCIVSLVEQMLKAKEKHASATTESEKNRLDIQIESLDRQIDKAVYEIYGLTEEEIRIVEGK